MHKNIIRGSAAVAAVGAAIVVWQTRSFSARNRRWSDFIDAAAAVSSRRPSVVRVSGGFPYRPIEATMRGATPEASSTTSAWKLMAAATELHDRAVNEPSGQTLHELGIAQLILQHPAEAVETLGSAIQRETARTSTTAAITASRDANLLSDLAAAYFERGRTRHQVRDLLTAAECAARAASLDRRSGEAAWNRAVVFEAIGVPDVARDAWSEFLEIDSVSPWSVEARAHLRVLREPPLAQRWEQDRPRLIDAAAAGNGEAVGTIVRRYPEQARTMVEEDLLGSWADARVANDHERATRVLATAASIANAVASVSNDSMARDATALALRSTAAPLISGYRMYRDARRLYKGGRHVEAAPKLAEARTHLTRAGSPLAFRAAAFEITAKHYLGRSGDALADGKALLKLLAPSAAAYPTADGQIRWTCGLAATELGQFDDALEYHRTALAAFQRTDETSNLAGLVQLLSFDYRAVGNVEDGWKYQLESFKLVSRYATFERAHVVIGVGALTALEDGYPMLADELQRGLLARARASREPIFIADILVRRAETLAALGLAGQARSSIDEALTEWRAIADTAIKSRLRADLEMVRAGIASDLTPRERLAQLDTALEYVRRSNSRSRIAKVMLLRARAHRANGDFEDAQRDLTAGLAEIERQRELTTTDETRLTFLDTAMSLYDEAIRARLEANDAAAAFDLLERRHARWLLDRFESAGKLGNAPPESWSALHEKLPPGVALVFYAVSDRIDAWVGTAKSLRHITLSAAPEMIGRDIASWRSALVSGNEEERNRVSADLYDALVAPLQRDLAAVRALVFVPDRILNSVPFNALRDRHSGRYLIENYEIGSVPSATLFVECVSKFRALPKDGSALVVANPALGRGESLQTLPGAATEGQSIVSLMRSSTVLRGTDATVERFMKAAPEASVIHIAAHVILNPVRPELSSLVFAPGAEGGRSHLYARDIYRMRLLTTRLVVVAACNSADVNGNGDSALSIATSFVAAGAPAAIASLWPVDDAESSFFFETMYRGLHEGLSPAAALRQAQITAIRTGSIGPGTWAAYQIVGGAT